MATLRKKLNSALSLLADNSGVGIITVMMAMFFVTALGSAILYMSYTGFLIRASEEEGIRNFYDAAELMDGVQVGFQHVASDALNEAYSETLVTYGLNPTDIFYSNLTENVFSWETGNSPTDMLLTAKYAETPQGDDIYVYNVEVLAHFLQAIGVSQDDIYIEHVSDPTDIDRPVHISGNLDSLPLGLLNPDFESVGTVEYDEDEIVFKGISVSFKDEETGLRTTVTSDITIEVPDYFSSATNSTLFNFSPIYDFSVISAGTVNTGGGSFGGSAYATNFNFLNSNVIEVTGMLVSPNPIILNNNNSAIEVKSGGQLWTSEVVLGNNASLIVEKSGAAYVADDISIDGDNVNLSVSGSLYGFGNSTEIPQESSAVVINGSDATLDFNEAQRVMLAGHSFILETEDINTSSGVMMGESLSVRPNQLAYLVPQEILTANNATVLTNPHVIDGSGTVPQFTNIPDSTVIFDIGGEQKTFGYYGAEIISMISPFNDSSLSVVYYFITFENPEKANEYFRDYFTLYPESITDYLETYVTLSEIGGLVETAGNYIVEDAAGTYSLPTIEVPVESMSEMMKTSFENLNITLSNYTNDMATNPFEHLVDIDKLEQFALDNPQSKNYYEFKDASGDVVGLAVLNKNQPDFIVFLNSYPDLHFLIATGNVQVFGGGGNNLYSGLVLNGGNVMFGTSGSSEPNGEEVRLALDSTFTDNDGVNTTLGSFLTTSGQGAIGDTDSQPPADVNSLVGYRNWTKS